MSANPITIVIADDHSIVREGLKRRMKTGSGFLKSSRMPKTGP